jgi:methyl-accepting chemotaxis protein
MNSLSTLFIADFKDRSKIVQDSNDINLIKSVHNPSGTINKFMDELSKSSEYPVQLKLASQNPANLLFISSEKDDQLISKLKNSGKDSYAVIEPDVNNIPVYYYVKAIKADSSCLKCHGKTPPSFMKEYYNNRSTGYSEGDIMAAAIFSSPIQYIKEENLKTIITFLAVLTVLFLLIIVILNVLINRLVVKPIKDLTETAEAISMGELSKEIKETSEDEIGKLQGSFERMRLSLSKIMEMMESEK